MTWTILDKMLLAEAAVMLTAVLLSVCFARTWLRCGRPLASAFRRIARNGVLSICLSGLLALSVSVSLSLLNKPEPVGHDEFSYLLGADTFAHGRLSNPTHPLWVHFESMHVFHHPTYGSKYPPGQALFLALGQSIGEQPMVGLWISMGLLGAAHCWMFQAWLPSRWALLCSLLTILHLGYGYWNRSYYGGAVAALGGALVFGSVPRLLPQPHLRYATILGLGLIILANSRPFEGFISCLPVAGLLLFWLVSKGPDFRRLALKKVVAPLALLLLLAAGGMAYYNWSIAGNPLVVPYQLHELRYMPAPFFVWQSPRTVPSYNHQALYDFYVKDALADHQMQQSFSGFSIATAMKGATFWQFYFGPLFTIPLVCLPWVWRDPWMRFVLLVIAGLAAGLFTFTWFNPHYAAPVTGLLAVVLVQCIRHLRLWTWRARPLGRLISQALVVGCAFVLLGYGAWHYFRVYPSIWGHGRARLLAHLKRQPGSHLVVVHYGPNHFNRAEWVYNEADIDAAKVVWARDMGTDQNRALLKYFKDRHIWLLEGDAQPPKLAPYPGE